MGEYYKLFIPIKFGDVDHKCSYVCRLDTRWVKECLQGLEI